MAKSEQTERESWKDRSTAYWESGDLEEHEGAPHFQTLANSAKNTVGPMLLLENQVNAVAKTIFFQFSLAWKMTSHTEKADLAMWNHTMVTTRLNNCSVLYISIPSVSIWKLQLVQNTIAHLLLKAK